jgi:toxin secretion/phage lysis holin
MPAGAKWAAGAAISLWGGLPAMLQMLAILMMIDYATGLINAWGKKELSSDVGRRGLVKKLQTIILICAMRYAQQRAGVTLHIDDGVTFAYVVNELISIVENCAHAGVPIPDQLVEAIKTVQKLRASPKPDSL